MKQLSLAFCVLFPNNWLGQTKRLKDKLWALFPGREKCGKTQKVNPLMIGGKTNYIFFSRKSKSINPIIKESILTLELLAKNIMISGD